MNMHSDLFVFIPLRKTNNNLLNNYTKTEVLRDETGCPSCSLTILLHVNDR